jgi:hypothetical protein
VHARHGAKSLDDIVRLLSEWAVAALEKSAKAFAISIQDFRLCLNAGEASGNNLYRL